MSEFPPTFGKRVGSAAAALPAATAPPSRAHLELAAAAREAFSGRAAPEAAQSFAVRPASREDDDMRAFIGPHWGAYRALWAKMKPAPRMTRRVSFLAGSLSSLWLLYRKQYRSGLAILAAQAVMMQTDVTWSSIFDVAVAGFVGRYGMSIVLVGGARKIAKLRETESSPDLATIRIGAAGGVNWVAALSGAALLIGIALANLSASFGGVDLGSDDMQSLLRALESR